MADANNMESGRDLPMLKSLWEHFTVDFPAPHASLEGRTVLVTGGNAGLGYASVIHYAQNNASRIIIASRSIERIQAAIVQVYRDVPNYRGKIDAMELDLSSFSSVISFCEKVQADPGRLDIVLANAGIMKAKYSQTMDGHEATMQVNGLSTGLMALLLLPKLEETAGLPGPKGSEGVKPSMCIVSSEVHYWAKFVEQNAQGSIIQALNDPKYFGTTGERYNVSKVLSVFTARELAKLPAVTSGKVNVNSANPGLCKSGFRDEMGPTIAAIMNWLSWTSEKGARNFLYATVKDTTPGSFISHCQEKPVSTFVASHKGRVVQEKYWSEAIGIWRKVAPQVDEVLSARHPDVNVS